VPSGIVDRDAWWWKIRIGEGPDGNGDRILMPFLRVEKGRATYRAEPEPEPGAVVSDTDILGR